jgi:pilus assembly protein Flp/PilA
MLGSFLRDESGATAIEYGLIAALVAVAIIISVDALGSSLGALFDGVKTKVNAKMPS